MKYANMEEYMTEIYCPGMNKIHASSKRDSKQLNKQRRFNSQRHHSKLASDKELICL